jgi:Fe2+ or Zn2+ uptake regulation protein
LKRAVKYVKKTDAALFCNMCGKRLKIENGVLKEDVLEITKEWGYFSDSDMKVHHFNICEECYNRLISQFEIPVEVRDNVEAL